MTMNSRVSGEEDRNKPRAYDLIDPDEFIRLARECAGYLKTCHRQHGTDWEGREYAIQALDAIWRRKIFPRAKAKA